MVDLLPILITATRTVQDSMKEWLGKYPVGMPWTVVSDYSVGDEEKKNDVFSFVVIANHDKEENISEYISAVAPQDIKKVRTVPAGLIEYLTCPLPVTFSVSFVIDRKSALLRDYLRVEHMASFIPDAREFVEMLRKNSPDSTYLRREYFDEVLQRLRLFEKDLARKQLNAKLSRQIHLASAFAATMFYLVTLATQPGHLRWISDRDKLIDHNDTVVYDLAYLYFALMLASHPSQVPSADGSLILNLPVTLFELPDKTGQNRFDSLIRLPDYLAGTLADLGPDMSCSKDKFREMLHGVFVNSPNNCVVQLTSADGRITARGVQYRA